MLLREISRRPDERAGLLASGAALQLIASSSAYLLMLVGLVFVGFPVAVQEAIALYGLIVFLEPAALLALPFQAELRLTRLLGPALAGVGLHFVLTAGRAPRRRFDRRPRGGSPDARLISDGWTLRLSLGLVSPPAPRSSIGATSWVSRGPSASAPSWEPRSSKRRSCCCPRPILPPSASSTRPVAFPSSSP